MSKHVITGTGNSVANYTEDEAICDYCEKGYVIVEKEELIPRLEYMYFQGVRFRALIKIAKEWRRTGKIICPQCDGAYKRRVQY